MRQLRETTAADPSRWLAMLVAFTATSAHAADLKESPAWRKPSAAVLVREGRELIVANQGTGTLSRIALVNSESKVVAEVAVGKSLSDVATIPGTPWLLATDFAAHRLQAIRLSDDKLELGPAIEVPAFPVSVCVSTDASTALVASLWSRRLTFVSLNVAEGNFTLSAGADLTLDFAPRLQLAIDAMHVLVADAFGGRMALADLSARSVHPLEPITGGNIRGLALSSDGQSVMLAHSIQNPLAYTDNTDIHWGQLTQNVLREIPVAKLLDRSFRLADSRIRQIGSPGFGAADPAGVMPLPNGEWLVASSGTGDVHVMRPTTRDESRAPDQWKPAAKSPSPIGNSFGAMMLPTLGGARSRIEVGQRPLKIIPGSDTRAYVLNQLSDDISVIDSRLERPLETISLGPQPFSNPAARGERLFYTAQLSHDRWLSCHSCHVDGHTTDGLVDTLSDGSFGTPKKVLSLLGTRDANPWAWNGGFRELHEQVRQSITSSMQGKEPTLEQVSDLVAFLHTLPPAPPVLKPQTEEKKRSVDRGREVFGSQGCGKCHVPSLTYTTDAVFDVGFVDEAGLSKFNPPSLRGVSQRSAFLHDGRAKSLRSVFADHNHQVSAELSSADLNALLEFLKTI